MLYFFTAIRYTAGTYIYLYKIESPNLLTVCIANANAKHDISYTTGFSMFRRWMLAHYIGDFVCLALIKPRKSYALIWKNDSPCFNLTKSNDMLIQLI